MIAVDFIISILKLFFFFFFFFIGLTTSVEISSLEKNGSQGQVSRFVLFFPLIFFFVFLSTSHSKIPLRSIASLEMSGGHFLCPKLKRIHSKR